MRHVFSGIAIIALTEFAAADFHVVYSNTASGPHGGHGVLCGSEFADMLHLTSGGILEGAEFSLYNSDESPRTLISAVYIAYVYNWNDGDPELVCQVGFEHEVEDLEPGEWVTAGFDHLYSALGQVGITHPVDSTILVSVRFFTCWWDTGLPGFLGQVAFGPPTIGDSDDNYWVHGIDGWDPRSFDGDPIANFYWTIEVYRCDGAGEAGKYCTADIYPNDGDGIWNPLYSDDGDCTVDLLDLAQLLGHYGTTSGATREDGDVYPENGDGTVDLFDLAELLGQFGNDCSLAAPVTALGTSP